MVAQYRSVNAHYDFFVCHSLVEIIVRKQTTPPDKESLCRYSIIIPMTRRRRKRRRRKRKKRRRRGRWWRVE